MLNDNEVNKNNQTESVSKGSETSLLNISNY